MQKRDFNDGSYCLHGLRGIIDGGRVSAWFDRDGTLQDCEWFPERQADSPRAVPTTWRHVRTAIQAWGRPVRHPEFSNVADSNTKEA